jgi:hypothetical protein
MRVRSSGNVAWSFALGLALGCGHAHVERSDDPTSREFIAAARAATTRYRSQDAAVADGYHQVGTDFPGMGEHWVNLAQVMADTFTATKPSVLTYVRVGGVPQLAGVAYTALLTAGEKPPAFPAARDYWHEHNGSITDESFLRSHDMVGTSTGGEMRLAILHAWIWVPNPAGVFVTDNWTLPLVRLGIAPPPRISPSAARMAALATSAATYYHLALDEGLEPTDAERARIDTVLDDYGRRASRALNGAVTAKRLTANDADVLAELWNEMWDTLDKTVPQQAHALGAARHRLSTD